MAVAATPCLVMYDRSNVSARFCVGARQPNSTQQTVFHACMLSTLFMLRISTTGANLSCLSSFDVIFVVALTRLHLVYAGHKTHRKYLMMQSVNHFLACFRRRRPRHQSNSARAGMYGTHTHTGCRMVFLTPRCVSGGWVRWRACLLCVSSARAQSGSRKYSAHSPLRRRVCVRLACFCCARKTRAHERVPAIWPGWFGDVMSMQSAWPPHIASHIVCRKSLLQLRKLVCNNMWAEHYSMIPRAIDILVF